MIAKSLLASFALVIAVAATGCISGPGFQCSESSQCGTAGTCEGTGYCSFPDGICSSGRRYGEAAGSESGRCTRETSDGGPDADPTAPDASTLDAIPPDADVVDYDPSNIDMEHMVAGTGDLVLTAANPAVTLNAFNGVMRTPAGALDLPPGVSFMLVEQPGEPTLPDLGILRVRNLVIEPGVTLTVIGNAALVVAVSVDADIGGVIDGSGGYEGIATAGPGGFAGGAANAAAGRGPGGGQSTTSGGDTGGGGGGFAAGGGNGGGRNTVAGGAGGVSYGEADLEPLIGGSGGGMAGGSASTRGRGGGGGGAIQISARSAIRIGAAGAITVGGGGGGGGGNDDGGGGGGAGGAILLEARDIVNGGVLAANGGGGGAGADANATPTALPGANGQRGAASTTPALGGARSGEGRGGGDGAAGGTTLGEVGETAAGTFDDDNAGGGGGAGGRIRLRYRSSAPGVVSPADSATTEASL